MFRFLSHRYSFLVLLGVTHLFFTLNGFSNSALEQNNTSILNSKTLKQDFQESNDAQLSDNFNWSLFVSRWEDYVQSPSRSKAHRLSSQLPRNGISIQSEKEREAANFVSSNLDIVEKRIRSSHKDAVQLAFRLLLIPDKEIRDSMNLALAGLIRNNPEVFLSFLKKEKSSTSFTHNTYQELLTKTDQIQSKNKEQRREELERRIKSLRRVDNPRLVEIRDACIQTLEKYTQKI